MYLQIEATETKRANKIQKAYNKALNTTTVESLINSLRGSLIDCIIGKGGNHIWIADKENKNRVAMIVMENI